MEFENFIKEQAEQLIELQKKAYQSGFEAGYKQKEKELEEEAKKTEAKLNQLDKN